jgi:hypothetical protein
MEERGESSRYLCGRRLVGPHLRFYGGSIHLGKNIKLRIADRVQDARTVPPRHGTIWELRGTRISVHWDGTEDQPGRNFSHVKAKHLALLAPPDNSRQA